DNPDIELGLTTADPDRWSDVTARFADALRAAPLDGRELDVRANVRFPTGGHFPEWVYARWGSRVCTISPEYKKIFMDEWTGQADIASLYALRDGLQAAVDAVRPAFEARRGAPGDAQRTRLQRLRCSHCRRSPPKSMPRLSRSMPSSTGCLP